MLQSLSELPSGRRLNFMLETGVSGENLHRFFWKFLWHGVHKLMLEDTVRNETYRKAIFDNKEAFQGKTVLDVGTGTGILSILCAQAGAACVYAIEASEIYKIAEEIVRENNFENVIHVIHSRVEDFVLPENSKVDIIISEWMGHYLLNEGMLDSVIFARDTFLRPGGLIFPENATLYCAPCSVPSFHDNWKDVSGVSMVYFNEILKKGTLMSPQILTVKPNEILTDPEVLLWIDLREVTVEELKCARMQHVAVVDKVGKYQGVCLWFTCGFPSLFTEPVVLSTDPNDPETHWRQTVIVLPIDMEVEEGMALPYNITITRNIDNNRVFSLYVELLDPDFVEHPEYCNCYYTKCLLSKAVLNQYDQNLLLNENLQTFTN